MARFDRAILPGGEGEVVLTLKTRGYQGKLRKSAVIYSNDPKHPQITLSVQAYVNVPISLDPKGVLLSGFVGDEIEQVVTIMAHENQPLTLEPVKFSLPDKVTYELKTIEAGSVYQVGFRNISPKEDKYTGFLTLKTNYSQKPEITIGFVGYITKKMKVYTNVKDDPVKVIPIHVQDDPSSPIKED